MLFGKAEEAPAAPARLLTPDNCVDSSRIRAFLRLSRSASDDTIRQHLNEIDKTQCGEYFASHIAPQWEHRADAISYCARYALQLRQQSHAVQANDAVHDYRTDPYAGRALADQAEDLNRQCVTIENWVENELQVESIIREQTTRVLNDKCYYLDWLESFKKLSRL